MITLKQIITSYDEDLFRGIDSLNKYIPHNLCIDSRELVHWIDNYNIKFNDQMYCFVIKKNYEEVIGWLQFTHFKDKFVFLDYLIVDQEYRTKEIMTQIYKLVNQKIDETGCNSIVLECGNEMPQHDAIVRLYEMFGFKKFDFEYKEPKVDIYLDNQLMSWGELPSTLMYRNLIVVDSEDVLKTIYFDHYMRWYSLYQLDMSKYDDFLADLINKVLKSCNNCSTKRDARNNCIHSDICEKYSAWQPPKIQNNTNVFNSKIKIRFWNTDYISNPIMEVGILEDLKFIERGIGKEKMLFSHLYDAHKKEIYDGDILQSTIDLELFNWLVSFEAGGFILQNIGIDGFLMQKFPLTASNCSGGIVIGNKFANKELLKGI